MCVQNIKSKMTEIHTLYLSVNSAVLLTKEYCLIK